MVVWDQFWTDICPTGLRPWVQTNSDLAPCFQELILQLPVLALFATFSAYYYGTHWRTVSRNQTQLRALRVRIFASLGLTFVPALKVLYIFRLHKELYPVDILLACVQLIAWPIHCCFLLSSVRKGSLSHRGPLALIVLWTSLFALSAIWLHTNLYTDYWLWYAAQLALYLFYGATLVAPGNAHYVRLRRTDDQERQALLSQSYTRFFEDIEETALGPIEDDANVLSKFVFYWVRPLIAKAVSGKLKRNDDLFDLPEALTLHRVTEKLQTALSETSSLLKALHKCFGWEFYLIGLLRLLGDLSGFAGPLLLGALLRMEINGNSTVPVDPADSSGSSDFVAYYHALGLFGSAIISAFAAVHFNWRMTFVSSKMRMSIVTAIYQKSLTAKQLQAARPEILNLMSTDTDRIVNSCISFHSFWSIPFQLFTTLYLLYTQLGVAFVAGVLFAILLIPINRKIAQKIGQLSQGLMAAKDARVTITTETISGAKDIKLNAWEDVFISKIHRERGEEISFLAKRKYLDALCVYFWATTPVLMCLFTFGTSILLGKPLTAATTYTSVALLNMLIGPLNAFPWVLNGLTEAWVSLKRVQELLDLPDVNLQAYYRPLTASDAAFANSSKRPVVLAIKDGSFEFETKRSRKELDLVQEDIIDFAFRDLTLQVRQGELVCLEGPVGGGKSSLLQVIMGYFQCTAGAVAISMDVKEGFGYVAQTPWLQQGTIRDNILWGEIYDEARYKAVIHACALQYDLDALRGDSTGVGEQGRTLSGGQKARVALARAVYQNKSIYLLDDILSALDAHVASHIIRHCLFGLLKDKTRIIVTQHSMVLNRATQILHVEAGQVTQSDAPNVGSLLSDYDDYDEDTSTTLSMANGSTSYGSVREDDDQRSNDSVLMEESREFGHLDQKVLGAYWKATGRSLGFWVIMSVLMMQVSRNLTDAWLAYWVGTTNDIAPNSTGLAENPTVLELKEGDGVLALVDHALLPILTDGSNGTATPFYYLGVYATLAISNSLLTLLRAFLFAYAGLKAAKCIHDRLLNSVLYTKLQFFDVVPLGRILNRFSSDVYAVDDTLPFIMNILLAQFFGLLGALLISLYAMPWLGLLIVPLVPIYLSLQNKYRFASRDIKRLSSNALSPLYAHFTETLQGLTTIRALRGEKRFQRDFLYKLGESIKSQLSAAATQQWLGLRLQLLGAFLVGGSGLLAAITSAHMTSPELVGLAISYALSITGLLSGLLYAVAETEQEFVAVERINQYCQLEPEINADGSADPPFGWPSQGVVVFDNVHMRYREHLTCSIRSINLNVKPCERISIVGRTGSGKTSVLASLLRVAPLDKGTIAVDFVNIATLPLDVLRSRIALISQDPFLFNGTIRDNLDPRAVHIDSEIWEAINCCLASPLVQALGGLYGRLDVSGANLSAGQKQLLCLTRALLKKSKIVLIDEGTSNLDFESESAIQLVLKNAFRGRTVIVVAHRLKGILDTDQVFVMQDGTVNEQGVPRDLAEQPNSLFYSLLQEQQNS
ncbi:ATP-binding cassette sub-family C member 10 [Anopheles merus]|uniref:ABC-type xenobiotic transporter n=1 Tax=Anopheles merus TaxID=30066 RepID=A0A182V448_ANOME|nr:ATP-binding cassette sub-family C member 10 [Anopheles merus]XP_041780047.1 ATP-binding cassette sub-family C member 10 [Anopheles merus]XP_041780049.1 ATP-binding cassette sub-family C member 10 [Anopheles merus]